MTIHPKKENRSVTRTFKPLAADPCGLWIGLRRAPSGEKNRFSWSSRDKSKDHSWVPAGTPGYPKGMPSDDPSRTFVHIDFNPNAVGYWTDSDNTYQDVVIGGGIAEFSP